MTQRLQAVQAELAGRAPAGLEALDDASLDWLATKIRDAKSTQERALDESVTRGLAAVPALLRRPVKKVLFG